MVHADYITFVDPVKLTKCPRNNILTVNRTSLYSRFTLKVTGNDQDTATNTAKSYAEIAQDVIIVL